ncbi:ABC transporter ATP-binding protein [Ruegeria sp. HKCCD8929]|uniref:ABC transporter ATP-binding protein n=1 Tax=Ruegeria sp. HKCCD8929 TaxID=2683006 RepID=UPI00148796DB|nr:ABC transporter ATP-binding protein [Ruegeria sp. HKCCD8929]
MTVLPPLTTRDRVVDAVLVVSCGIGQAAALAVAAFATRDGFAALHSGNGLAINTVIELATSGVIAAVCFLGSRYRAEALGQSYAISLRRALYRQIARLPKSRHEQRRVGALSLRFVGDLSAARLWFGRGLPDVLSASVVLPGAIAILFALNPVVAGVGLVPLGVALLVMGATAWHLERRHSQLRRRRASIAISMIERIAIAPELDLMGRTNKELRRLDDQGASLRNDAMARRGKTSSLQAILQTGVALSGLLILWLAGRNGIAPASVAASLSVLGLIALPLQDLCSAWDHYCAWRVARRKAQRLLSEPIVKRRWPRKRHSVTVEVRGTLDREPVAFTAKQGVVTRLRGEHAHVLARCISGLDKYGGLDVLYNGQQKTPRIAYIGDDHIGLQGSLRRSASLMCRKRPNDRNIAEVLRRFGLGNVLAAPRSLDQRLSENGNGLSAEHSMKLDLARAVLGEADVVVIASLRWWSVGKRSDLLETFCRQSAATVILVETENAHSLKKNSKVI